MTPQAKQELHAKAWQGYAGNGASMLVANRGPPATAITDNSLIGSSRSRSKALLDHVQPKNAEENEREPSGLSLPIEKGQKGDPPMSKNPANRP